MQLLEAAKHVRLLVPEVVEVGVHCGREQPALLVVELQLVPGFGGFLVQPRDDEGGVPRRPVVVGLAALLLVGAVGALRDAEQRAQPILRSRP